MLAGPGDRLPVAVELAREHRAPVLVISRGHLGYGGPCPGTIPGQRIVCFEPDPSDTRGEAEYIGRLADARGWRALALVVTREQASRARILTHRCYGGAVYVITAPRQWYDWPYQIAYGWGSLVKAMVLVRSC